MDNEFERLAFDVALRSIDKQEAVLTEIRARTGVLLAAASLSASLLGRPAVEETGRSGFLLAVAALAVAVLAGVYVLMPKKGLTFALSGVGLYESLYRFREDMAEVYRRSTYDLQQFWESNDATIVRLVFAYRVGASALVVEVALLLAAVTDTII